MLAKFIAYYCEEYRLKSNSKPCKYIDKFDYLYCTMEYYSHRGLPQFYLNSTFTLLPFPCKSIKKGAYLFVSAWFTFQLFLKFRGHAV